MLAGAMGQPEVVERIRQVALREVKRRPSIKFNAAVWRRRRKKRGDRRRGVAIREPRVRDHPDFAPAFATKNKPTIFGFHGPMVATPPRNSRRTNRAYRAGEQRSAGSL